VPTAFQLGNASVRLASKEGNDALRVVGFGEYTRALQRLDKLVEDSTPEELSAYDELVKARDDLAVYANLSRRFQQAPSSLAEPPRDASDKFERRGLAWVMALARVEVGATLAAFTDVKRPFEAIAGKGYDREAYGEMLLDGLRTHYLATAADDRARTIIKRKPDAQTLNYVRRLDLVIAFQQAVAALLTPAFSTAQRQEFSIWQRQIEEARVAVFAYLQSYAGTSQDAITKGCVAGCKRLARHGEK
jgi:hypothetical protein